MGGTKEGGLSRIDVPDEQPREGPARFAALAEAPAYHEMRNGRPLHPSGPSGSKWNRILFILGVRRRETYTGNFLHTQLPGNNTEKLWKVTDKGNFKTAHEWEDLVVRFRETLRGINSSLIILLGETPLVGLFGPDYAGLKSLRGYPFFWEGKTIIPTHHPASALPGYTPSNQWLMFYDVLKGLRIDQYGRDLKPYNIWIPGKQEVIQEVL